MAIVEATRELEPQEARPIGWDGKRVDEMLAESERLFAETGSYYGLAGELELKDSDPIGYEKLFARLRGGLVSAREINELVKEHRMVRATYSKDVTEVAGGLRSYIIVAEK